MFAFLSMKMSVKHAALALKWIKCGFIHSAENPDTNYDDDDWEDLSIEELALLFLNFI